MKSLALVLLLFLAGASPAQPPLSGREVMRRVNERDPGKHCRLELSMELQDLRGGGSYVREVEVVRKEVAGGHRTRYRVTEPERYRDIALLFLEDLRPPQMWMYFPASKHRAQVAMRGISALGGDFSCEDLKAAFDLDGFDFRFLGRETREGREHLRIEMTPRSPALARELGYSKAVGVVRTDPWMVIAAEYFDAAGRPLRSFHAAEIERMDGVWIARRYSMENTRIGHRTVVRIRRADCRSPVPGRQVELEHLGGP